MQETRMRTDGRRLTQENDKIKGYAILAQDSAPSTFQTKDLGPGCRFDSESGDQFIYTDSQIVQYFGFTGISRSSTIDLCGVFHPLALVRLFALRGTCVGEELTSPNLFR